MSQLEHDCRIDYVEFPVADVAVARRFCSSVFDELAVWSDPVSRG